MKGHEASITFHESIILSSSIIFNIKYFLIDIWDKCFKKVRREDYIKSSCIIFCVKMTEFAQRFFNYIKFFLAKCFNLPYCVY